MGEFDGFVVITPECNHGIPGVLKNAFDHLHAERGDRLVAYGVAGGARSLDQLRVLSWVLGMADVMPQVELSLFEDFAGDGVLAVGRHVQTLRQLFDKVEGWSSALLSLRS
ncbi:NAD(P)H-dependent oxidoreductase [Rhodococcus sp. IEGM 1379]|nr:NAD(P)H-dependent oxidoreductase [Rhodococcus sp. IEGM 1379]MDI9916821.1 NAD(P)H-dependent oxidoreductase [Rhodococcus sp. IEGM 1379]